ncbi:hypothetical protein GGI07_002267 [Coemansia sp. Benny D115]|nr:hypothetical protein GGI07_002267 [Coemansia sp. Benny D115]
MDIVEIERREHLGVADFVRDFLEPNIPVVLGPSLTSHWPARRDWVTADGRPSFAHLAEVFGTTEVQVAECDIVYFSDQKRTTIPFCEFLQKWQHGPEDARLYCKDWHFVQACPQRSFYRPLGHLSDDWINLYYDANPELKDDYKFCYMGGNGTWTPFHEDVFRSYSWSANICGRKRWILVPPGQNHLFTDSLGNWVYNLLDYDAAKFPRLTELKTLEIIQYPGETVFVPAGWWHQVSNIGDTISINHNWSNEFGLRFMYERLRGDLANVKYALRDVADMEGFHEHAQLVLKADSGTDYPSFVRFVRVIAQIYIDFRQNKRSAGAKLLADFDDVFCSPEGTRRALQRILDVAHRLLDDPDTKHIDGLHKDIKELKEMAESALVESI